MIEKILAGTLALSIGGCSMLGGFNSLDPKNLIKTAATTAVAYTVAGPLPAAANLATSIAIDEVLPDDKPAISEIEEGNQEQMIAYIVQNLTTTVLYIIIGFLVFTNVVGPWAAQRRARRKAEAAAEDRRRKDKYDTMKAELNARRAKE
jgi:hypothetical protein|tara:strand:+ start:7280 stop:7726 length:447 start_codon:yes stop_codon:yes gene_type:complete